MPALSQVDLKCNGVDSVDFDQVELEIQKKKNNKIEGTQRKLFVDQLNPSIAWRSLIGPIATWYYSASNFCVMLMFRPIYLFVFQCYSLMPSSTCSFSYSCNCCRS